MQEHQSIVEPGEKQRKSRLLRIVIAHLMIVIAFFVAVFFWGNFA